LLVTCLFDDLLLANISMSPFYTPTVCSAACRVVYHFASAFYFILKCWNTVFSSAVRLQ